MILDIDRVNRIVYLVDPKISDSYWNELERTLERHKIQDYQLRLSKIIINPYLGFIENENYGEENIY